MEKGLNLQLVNGKKIQNLILFQILNQTHDKITCENDDYLSKWKNNIQ